MSGHRGRYGDKRVQHGTARDAQHVCDHVRELDVGRLQQLVHTVGGLDPIPDEALPMSREIAQVADRWRRDEDSYAPMCEVGLDLCIPYHRSTSLSLPT